MYVRTLAAPLVLLAACSGADAGVGMNPVVRAVTERDLDGLVKQLAAGGDPNSRDDRGKAVLLIATGSDQFRIANALVGAGADVWFADSLGNTPAVMAEIARLKPGSEEAAARDAFIAHLQSAHYPWPPPRPVEIRALRDRGAWPPHPAAHGG